MQHLKLLLVDDEKHIRNLLKILIDWNSLEIDICGEASCAEEGLLLVDEMRPNLIISDICMDYMDGIEFSKLVKERYPYTKIILLSGHDEFDYARRGIDANVSAYLLKPIEETKLTDTLISLKKQILKESEKEFQVNQLQAYLRNNRDSMICNCFNSLMMPNPNLNLIIQNLSYLDINFESSFFQVVVFSLESTNLENTEKTEMLSFALQCNEILRALTQNIADLYVFFDLYHQNILLSNNRSFQLLSLLEDAKMLLLERLPVNLTIGVGQPCETIHTLRNSYLSAINAVKYNTLLGYNQIFQYNYPELNISVSPYQLNDEIDSLLMEINACNLDESIRIVDSCIQHQVSSDSPDLTRIKATLSTIINHLINQLSLQEFEDSDAFHYCILSLERLFRFKTVPELRNMTINLIRSVIETYTEHKKKLSNTLVDSVIHYLEENYSNSQLTLSATAEHFFVNPSYLSRLFSQQNRVTFSRYLIELRLNKAAQLLLSSNLKSYEIAEKTGFSDPKYFSTSFKKQFGMTTNEYRTHAKQAGGN